MRDDNRPQMRYLCRHDLFRQSFHHAVSSMIQRGDMKFVANLRYTRLRMHVRTEQKRWYHPFRYHKNIHPSYLPCSAFACAPSVVAANGQPLPGPFKFWSVTTAALMRPSLSWTLSPVRKLIFTVGFMTAFPA
jgi:hypothetical protein